MCVIILLYVIVVQSSGAANSIVMPLAISRPTTPFVSTWLMLNLSFPSHHRYIALLSHQQAPRGFPFLHQTDHQKPHHMHSAQAETIGCPSIFIQCSCLEPVKKIFGIYTKNLWHLRIFFLIHAHHQAD